MRAVVTQAAAASRYERVLLLVSLKLRAANYHARLLYDDGHVVDVDGTGLVRLLNVAGPLLDYARTKCDGPLRALSLMLRSRVLRATYDTESGVGVIRIDADQFDRDVAPLCASLEPALP